MAACQDGFAANRLCRWTSVSGAFEELAVWPGPVAATQRLREYEQALPTCCADLTEDQIEQAKPTGCILSDAWQALSK